MQESWFAWRPAQGRGAMQTTVQCGTCRTATDL